MGNRRAASRTQRGRAETPELLGFHQVLETWWIAVPLHFDETWVSEGGYWHAWDEHRSVSMSSTVLTDEDTGRPVPAGEMMDRFGGVLEGDPIAESPPGLEGRATIIRTDPGSRASRALSGFVVVDGRVLVTTITSDDIDWAVRIWRSIGFSARADPARRNKSRGGSRTHLVLD